MGTEKRKKSRTGVALRIFFGVVSAALLADSVAGIVTGLGRNIGGYTGVVISLGILLYCLFCNIVNCFFSRHVRLRLLTLVVLSLCFIYIFVGSFFIVSRAHLPAPESSRPPVVVVLGCRVKGLKPSILLGERIKAAYEYLSANPDSVCICSGGQGDDEIISEAQCIRDELVKMGIPASRLYMEDKSTSSRENLKFSKEIMEREDLGDTIVIVTNSWHELRAQMVASDLGIPCGGYGAHTPLWLVPSYHIRELYGVVYQIFL